MCECMCVWYAGCHLRDLPVELTEIFVMDLPLLPALAAGNRSTCYNLKLDIHHAVYVILAECGASQAILDTV